MPLRSMSPELRGAAGVLVLAVTLLPCSADAVVTLDCPPDLVVECDGTGNLAERQAWLDTFTAEASMGCGRARETTEVEPANILDLLRFEDFADLTGWTLNGTTGVLGNPVVTADGPVLRLTNELWQSGSAFTSRPVTLADDASFDAFFSFRISDPVGSSDGDGVGADGIVFVVQSVSDTAGGAGGGIGYDGIPRSVGVEFDTWNNGAGDANSGNHVGIDVGGSVNSVTLVPVAGRMNDGLARHAWVTYDGATDVLDVFLADVPQRPAAPILSWTVDVAAELGTTDAFVGFTSGTGAAGGDHDILSLFFRTTRPAEPCGLTGAETVLYSATDNCDDTAQCDRAFIVRDTIAPTITVDGTPCDGIARVIVSADSWDGAFVDLVAEATDACDPFARLTNDRTGDGGDASGTFPCGPSWVLFEAEDACGNAATCLVSVQVDPPAAAESVGSALRVSKDPAGDAALDWSLAGPPGEARWVVLRGRHRARPIAWAGPPLGAPSWTHRGARADLTFFDVRVLTCDGRLSDD